MATVTKKKEGFEHLRKS